MQAMAWYLVRCDRCSREHKLGDERAIEKMASAIRIFTADDSVTEKTVLMILAHCAGYIVFGEDSHRCSSCRAIREEVDHARAD